MGKTCSFTCKTCHHTFRTSEGGGMRSTLLRCEVCDTTQLVGNDKWPDEEHTGKVPKEFFDKGKIIEIRAAFKCAACKGQMRDDLTPMCPKCRSRDTVESSKRVRYACKRCNEEFLIDDWVKREYGIVCDKCETPCAISYRDWFDMDHVNRLPEVMKKCIDLESVRKLIENRSRDTLI